ncbi:MAG: PorP/SprF family type IX secretion system membrane protein [Bacteroidota bacterium]
MKKSLLIFLVILVHQSIKAQLSEEAVFTQYTANHAIVNPGAIGFNDGNQAFMNIRRSLQGFPGSPTSYAISYNGAAGEVLGLGANIFSENVAQLTRFRFQAGVGVRFKITDDLKLAGGLTGEISQRKLGSAILDNDLYQIGDELVENNVAGVRFFDVSFGVYGSFKENTYFGISSPNLVTTRLNSLNAKKDSIVGLSLLVGHKFDFGEIQFEPSLMALKMESVPLRIDVNLLAHFLDEQFTAGLIYRHIEAPFDDKAGGNAAILLGVKITAFKLYYSYDVSFLGFQQFNGGGHEVTIAFDFKGDKASRSRRRKF